MMMKAYHSQQELGFEAVDSARVPAIRYVSWESYGYANGFSKQGLSSHESAFESTHLSQQQGVSMLQDNPQNKGQHQDDWNDMNLLDDSTRVCEGNSIVEVAIRKYDSGTSVAEDTSTYVPEQHIPTHESSEDLGIELGKGGVLYKQDQETFEPNGSSEHEFTQETDASFSTCVPELQTTSTCESSEEDLGVDYGKGGVLYKQDQFDSSMSSEDEFTQEPATQNSIEYNKGGVTYHGLRQEQVKRQVVYLVLLATLLATQVVMIATVSRLSTPCQLEHEFVPHSRSVLLTELKQQQIVTDKSDTHLVQPVLQHMESHNYRPVNIYEMVLYSDAFTTATDSNSISDMQLNELSQGQLLLQQFLQYEERERLRIEYWLSFSRRLKWTFRPQSCTSEEDERAEICDNEPTTVCQVEERNVFVYDISHLKDQSLPRSATMDATTLYSTYRLSLNVPVLRSHFVAIANKVLDYLTLEELASLLVVLLMLSGILVPNIRASSLQATLKRFLHQWITLFLTAALLVTYYTVTVHASAEPVFTANRSEPTGSSTNRHSGSAYPTLVGFESIKQKKYSFALESTSFPSIFAAIGNEHTWLVALLTLHVFRPLLAFFIAINYRDVYRNALQKVSYYLADSYSSAQVTIHYVFQLFCERIKPLFRSTAKMNMVNSSCLHTNATISSFKSDLEVESFEKSDIIIHSIEQGFGDHQCDLKQETDNTTSESPKCTIPNYAVTKLRWFMLADDLKKSSYMEVKPSSLIPDCECRRCESNKISVQCYPTPRHHIQGSTMMNGSETKQSERQVSSDACSIDYLETIFFVTSSCGNDICQELVTKDSSKEPLIGKEKDLLIINSTRNTKVPSQSSDVITNYFVGSSQASFSFEIDGVYQDGTKIEFEVLTSVKISGNNRTALVVIHPASNGHGTSLCTTTRVFPDTCPQLNVWEASGNVPFFVFVRSFSMVSVEIRKIFRGIMSHLMLISNRQQVHDLLGVLSTVSDHSVSTDDSLTFTREAHSTDHPKFNCSTTRQNMKIVNFENIDPPENERLPPGMIHDVNYESHSQNIHVPKNHTLSYERNNLPSVLVQRIQLNITRKLGTSPTSGYHQKQHVPPTILPDTEKRPPMKNFQQFTTLASMPHSYESVENITIVAISPESLQDDNASVLCVRKGVPSSNADSGKLKAQCPNKLANILINSVANSTTPAATPNEPSTSHSDVMEPHTQSVVRCGGKQESSVPGENVSKLVTCTSRNKQQISLDLTSHNNVQDLEESLTNNCPMQNAGSEVAVIPIGSILATNTNKENEIAPVQPKNLNDLPETTASITLMNSINSTLSSLNCHSSAVGLIEKDDVGLIQPANTSLTYPHLSKDQREGMLLANSPLPVLLSPPNLPNELAVNVVSGDDIQLRSDCQCTNNYNRTLSGLHLLNLQTSPAPVLEPACKPSEKSSIDTCVRLPTIQKFSAISASSLNDCDVSADSLRGILVSKFATTSNTKKKTPSTSPEQIPKEDRVHVIPTREDVRSKANDESAGINTIEEDITPSEHGHNMLTKEQIPSVRSQQQQQIPLDLLRLGLDKHSSVNQPETTYTDHEIQLTPATAVATNFTDRHVLKPKLACTDVCIEASTLHADYGGNKVYTKESDPYSTNSIVVATNCHHFQPLSCTHPSAIIGFVPRYATGNPLAINPSSDSFAYADSDADLSNEVICVYHTCFFCYQVHTCAHSILITLNVIYF